MRSSLLRGFGPGNENLKVSITMPTIDYTIIGEIRFWAVSTASMPSAKGWLPCDGAKISKKVYQKLFAVIGYTYGGSGKTFHVPDLRDYAITGAGQGPNRETRKLGEVWGKNSVVLSHFQMPEHSHSLTPVSGSEVKLMASVVDATTSEPSGASLARGILKKGISTTSYRQYGPAPESENHTVPLRGIQAQFVEGVLEPVGAGQPRDNRQPSLRFGFFIAAEGTIPTARNGGL